MTEQNKILFAHSFFKDDEAAAWASVWFEENSRNYVLNLRDGYTLTDFFKAAEERFGDIDGGMKVKNGVRKFKTNERRSSGLF